MAVSKLQPGDWAPHFTAPTNATARFAFGSIAGRYVILSFLGTFKHKACVEAHAHVLERHAGWLNAGLTAAYFAVLADRADIRAAAGKPVAAGARMVFDTNLAVSRAYGLLSEAGGATQYAATTFVVDPMLRILAVVPIDENHDRALDDVIANLPPLEEHAGRPLGAPVLVLPRVFEPEFCQDLIAQYEAQGGAPSGFMREVDGMTRLVNDNAFKRRSDCIITDEALQAAIIERIERRLAPGVRAAFQFAPTRVERYLVACYDAGSGGFFKAHRDNTTKGTAHRRFAVTINLNTEDYDGGDLRFPEFGSQTYRAPTGGAVVFGCSLLHEACPVTRGRRYAFLPFLFDEAGEAIRRQNLKFVEGSDGPPPGQSVVNP